MSHFSEPNSFTKPLFDQLKRHPKRIVFPEGEEEKILRAAQILVDEGIAKPILLGDEDEIKAKDYKIVRKLREKKQVNERYVKVRAVEIALDSDLIIKVMSPEDLYKD